jgi:uncharacterized protein YbjT (DUF2867 family)
MYVIIGASSHTGNAAANKLLEQGKKVRVVGRNANHLAQLAAKGAEPFIGSVTDKNDVTKAFAGAKAVYVMFPQDQTVQDYFLYADRLIDAYASAIEKNGVKHAVSLSSVGADKPDKTGPIIGLHRLEQRLNLIPGLNVLHVRAAYFMENTLGQVDAVAQMGQTAGPIRPELKFPLIAARDIGDFVGEALARLDFNGHQTHELHGERDLSYGEITSIIGKAIGKANLGYAKLTADQFRGALVRIGMSDNLAQLLVEMTDSMNNGHIKALEPRTSGSTTPTSYETFVAENIVPAFKKARPAA